MCYNVKAKWVWSWAYHIFSFSIDCIYHLQNFNLLINNKTTTTTNKQTNTKNKNKTKQNNKKQTTKQTNNNKKQNKTTKIRKFYRYEQLKNIQIIENKRNCFLYGFCFLLFQIFFICSYLLWNSLPDFDCYVLF